jgi:N,N'-diacetyllegionaminate synthase
VKFQSFLTAEFVAESDPSFAELKRLEMPLEWYETLREACDDAGVLMFSTSTNDTTLGWMEELGFPCYKVASAHVTYYPLLERTARLGKPMILSTGFSTLAEVSRAVETIAGAGNRQLVVMHCVGDYPMRPEDANLRVMHTLRDMFGCPVGYSDHAMGPNVALAAVALGADVIEKHYTFDRQAPGDDHVISVEPDELALLVKGVREIEAARGIPVKTLTAGEQAARAHVRRTLHAACAIPADTVLRSEMVRVVRPSDGLPPELLPTVVGRTTRRPLDAGQPITWRDL